VKLKYLATKIGSGKTPRGGNEVYSESGVVFLRSQNVYDDGLRLDDVVFIDHAIDEEMAQTRVRPGDVLLNITGASIGRTAIVPRDLPPSNVNQHVCIIRPCAKADPRFVSYALKSLGIKDQIRSFETGSSREGLNFEQVGSLSICIPSAPHQQQLVSSFLDRRTAQIDGVIAKKQRMIDLLHEKRQALISEAVTRGLDPEVPTKDSGIEWVGRVPKHWSVERLKYSITKIEQGWSPQCDNRPAEDDEWGVLKVGCGNRDEFDPSEQKALPLDVAPMPEYEIRSGDILMSRGNTRELVGAASLVKNVRHRLMLCDLLYRFHAQPRRADAEFLVFSLRSPHVRFQIEREASGTSASMKKVGQETIRELVLCLPPVSEQKAIIPRLRPLLDQHDQIVHRIESQISKLREYRQTLISAAVTGQIDVSKERQ
jgi:type I restriction enzyme S subunit